MTQRKRNPSFGFHCSRTVNWAATLVAMLLPGCLLAAQAAPASAAPPEMRPSTQARDGYVIKLDNSRGTKSLTFHEDLRQRQCAATVTPDSFQVAAGETAVVHLDVRDTPLSGCADESKHVLWNVEALETGRRTLAYKLLFSDDPKMDGQGARRIAMTKFNQPGTPYAATCGDHACLDEWVPRSGNDSTIFFYRRD